MNKLDIYYKSPSILQNIMISVGKYYSDLKFRKYIDIINRELEKTEKFSLNELKELQREKLRKLIDVAYNNVEYYNNLFKKIKLHPSDIKDLEDLKKIPFLTKDDVKMNYKKLINYSIPAKRYFYSHTSGTTGSPLQFVMDNYTQAYYRSHIIRHRRWHGMKVGKDWCASFGGRRVVKNEKLPLWRYDFPDKLIIYSTYHMNDQNMFEYYKHIRKKKIKYIKGYPSNLFIFAKFLNNNGFKLPMKAVFTGAEPLYDFIRSEIEKAFLSEVSDFYGNSEETARAYDCEYHNGLHVAMESIIMEIDNPDNDNFGEIIGTSLTNYAMPFIRYKTGDLTKILNKECNCGRKHLLIENVKTKREDIIYTKSGKYLSPSILTFPFKEIKHGVIERSKIIQENKGEITILIQKGINFESGEIDKLVFEFNQLLNGDINVKISFDEIPIDPEKKFRWVENRVINEK